MESALFGRFAENALVGIYAIQDGRFSYVNRAFEHMFGYGAGELLGQDPLVVVHPDERPFVAQNLQQSEAGSAGPLPVVLRGRRKDGATRYFEALGMAADLAGRHVVVGSAVDVTERLTAETELRASETRFRTLIDQAPVAIGMSRVGTTIWVNGAYLQMFGYQTDRDLIGHSLAEQIAPGCRREVLEWSARRAEGLEAPSVYETMGLRSDGSEFPMHVAVAEVNLPDGPVTVGFLTDLTELKQAEAELAFESSVESSLLEALHRLPPRATAQEAAEALCEAMWGLPMVSFAAVFGFSLSDHVTVLAHRAPPEFPPAPSVDARTRQLHEAARRGPHAEYWESSPDAGTWQQALTRMGLKAVAYAPIVHGDHVDGLLMVGTCDSDFARTFVERLPAVVAFSATSSALLAERLHARREEIETRARLARVVEEGAFQAVFQPVVDLTSGAVVGHEALTRFLSGERPDLCFADAWRVGVGPELEIATLRRAIESARSLPSGRWLAVNISPRLLAGPDALREAFSRVDRPLVLEVTEHEMIADYSAAREGLRGVAPGARVAVDDAGAGIANFAHIVELRPNFVKLDMSLVRRINLDLGRQALVIGMRHFAQSAGCRLVAEGVETKEEAETLLSLGVEYGQGWYFGKPEPIPATGSPARATSDKAAGRQAAR
jgi:PAS domain S-box-containing protein